MLKVFMKLIYIEEYEENIELTSSWLWSKSPTPTANVVISADLREWDTWVGSSFDLKMVC